MAKVLDTTGVSHYLVEMIKSTREKLLLISPYLKVNDRVRQLLEDLDRYKYDLRIVYGKSELQPQEIAWLEGTSIRTSFCKNLHAKCYLNESMAIITSMNLYEFSQVHNLEMGIMVTREHDPDLYRAIAEEAQAILRASEEIKMSVAHVEKVQELSAAAPARAAAIPSHAATPIPPANGKLVSTTQLAKSLGMSAKSLFDDFQHRGWIERKGDKWVLTKKGEQNGGQMKHSKDFGEYIVWPEHAPRASR